MNILILSCGTRNKIIQYFKKELKGIGKVIATDCSKLAPALYEADQHYIVPRVDEVGYLDKILSICKKNNVKGVLSLIDPELSLIAKNKNAFLEIGTVPIISDLAAIELAMNKYKMYEFLNQNNIKTVKSYIDKNAFYDDVKSGVTKFPAFVKPIKGSASLNINKVDSNEELELLFNKFDNLMIQEYMHGNEYGADVYIDMITGEIISIFVKEKLKMRSGETDKSVSYKDEKLFDLIKKFVKKVGLKGIVDIDLFKVNNEYYISEVNPRFGGGYPHAYECDINVPKMIVNNLQGKSNKVEKINYPKNIVMMKYNEVKVFQCV